MFYGRYVHAVDAKGRLAIPVKLREALRYEGERSIFYICRGPGECLRLFTEREFEKEVAKLRNSAQVLVGDQLDELRIFCSSAEKVFVDGQGRILLSAYHRNIAHITKDVMINGADTVIEIWDKKTWDAFESAKGPKLGTLPRNQPPEAPPAAPKAVP